MNKEELLKQLRRAHEKQLWDEEAVERVLDEYAEQESVEFGEWLDCYMEYGNKIEDYENLYDEWLNQQEEQQC